MDKIKQYSQDLELAILSVNQEEAESIIIEAFKYDTPIKIVGDLISTTLKRIGDLWESGVVSLSQVYLSGVMCEKIITNVIPPKDSLWINHPKMAIGVFEDFHMLGKRIIYSVLRASGIEITDLGGGLKTESILKIVKEENIKILLLSVLMLPSALRIKELSEKLALLDVKLVVGGAPFRFDEELWKEVGAYACGKDSAEALEIVLKLIGEEK